MRSSAISPCCEECNVAYELLDADQLALIEPSLAQARERLAGGLRLPKDETGDCHRFTNALCERARALGVDFRFDQTVDGLVTEGGRVIGVRAGGELLKADRFVLAFGSYSRSFLRPLGLDLPVYPVKGYSLTVPLVDPAFAPQSTVLDETYKIAVTRLDDRIRVGGMAELGGFDLRLDPRRRATLELVVNDLFPGGDLARATFWTGLRPMTPDSTPVIGATKYPNLYLNTGHGTLGWTMACGSAKLISDMVMGQRTEISASRAWHRSLHAERRAWSLDTARRRNHMTRPSRARVDLDALRHNYSLARRMHGGRALAVIKANAYGHGAVRCAQALQDHADGFAVAFLEEAAALRAAGIGGPILVLEGVVRRRRTGGSTNSESMDRRAPRSPASHDRERPRFRPSGGLAESRLGHG